MKRKKKNPYWGPELRTRDLPDDIAKCFIDEADFLYDELDKKRLEVVLIPAPDPQHAGHKIRLAVNHNPKWYSQFMDINPYSHRYRCVKALDKIKNNEDCRYHGSRFRYQFYMRDLIQERLTCGFQDSIEGHVLPIKKIRDYFKNMKRK